MNKKKSDLSLICFMILSMLCYSIRDSICKGLSGTIPFSQILILIGSIGSIVFFLTSFFLKVSLLNKEVRTLSFFFRTSCELISTFCFIVAVVSVSLSSASAVLQIAPILVIIGGKFFFNKKISLSNWILICLIIIGVVMILKFDFYDLNYNIFFAFVAVFFLAGKDLLTYSIASTVSPSVTCFWAFFSLTVAGLLCIPMFEPMTVLGFEEYVLLGLSLIFCPLAYVLLIFATREGNIAVVSPYRYTRLPFALILSVIFFNGKMDLAALLGCILIVGAGFLLAIGSKKTSDQT